MTDYVESAPELIGTLEMRSKSESQTSSEPLADLAVRAPQVSDLAIKNVLSGEYGVSGSWSALLSERDQNLRVLADDGSEYVFKIANGAEDRQTTDLQVRVLEHLEKRQCPVPTPRIVRNRSGETLTTVKEGSAEYQCRLVSFVSGTPQSMQPDSEALAEHLGLCAVRLLDALEDF